MNNKTIHIIWLGPKPVYDKYMSSLRKYCPKDFTIKIWRDDEVVPLCNNCEYFNRHYAKQNWAFCSDYARFKILYTYGGVYLDTDVELLKPFDDLIEKGTFFACEKRTKRVNTGHIMYVANPGEEVIYRVMKFYEDQGHRWQYLADGEVLADGLKKYGYVLDDYEQHLSNGITVYKGGTFDGDMENPEPWARAIHWYTHMWVDVRTLPENRNKPASAKPVVD